LVLTTTLSKIPSVESQNIGTNYNTKQNTKCGKSEYWSGKTATKKDPILVHVVIVFYVAYCVTFVNGLYWHKPSMKAAVCHCNWLLITLQLCVVYISSELKTSQ